MKSHHRLTALRANPAVQGCKWRERGRAYDFTCKGLLMSYSDHYVVPYLTGFRSGFRSNCTKKLNDPCYATLLRPESWGSLSERRGWIQTPPPRIYAVSIKNPNAANTPIVHRRRSALSLLI